MAPGKMRWGDAADVQGSSVHGEAEPWNGRTKNDLPPPQIYGPDEKGIKTTVEYRYNEDGQKVKITKKTRVLKKKKVISKDTMARKQWEKFGDAKGIAPGTDNLTAVSTDEIYVERPKKLGMKQEDEQVRRRRRTSRQKKYTRRKEAFRAITERCARDVEYARRKKNADPNPPTRRHATAQTRCTRRTRRYQHVLARVSHLRKERGSLDQQVSLQGTRKSAPALSTPKVP